MNDTTAIEVVGSDGAGLRIPEDAEPEDWEVIQDQMYTVERVGKLAGHASIPSVPWNAVYHCVDHFEQDRWYFVDEGRETGGGYRLKVEE